MDLYICYMDFYIYIYIYYMDLYTKCMVIEVREEGGVGWGAQTSSPSQRKLSPYDMNTMLV
jgi:hypothetical protein